ncbi:chalcone isomerase [Geomonas sp. Red276]
MRILLALLITLLLAGTAPAKEIAGVAIEPTVNVDHHQLNLNGSGIRKKFFVKVYIGSLYATKKLNTAAEALRDPGDKLIRMNFLYHKVDKEKIIEAFREGFANNSPAIANSVEVKRFLALFTDDFVRGDTVDIYLSASGKVTVKHNGKMMGSVSSPQLGPAVLAIYLGNKPADEDLKAGMLGR